MKSLLRQLQNQLLEHETVTAIFSVMLMPGKDDVNLLVFTNARLLGANRPKKTSSPLLAWRIPQDQVMALTVGGLHKVTVKLTTGDSVSMSARLDRNDIAALDHYAWRLIAGCPKEVLAVPAATLTPDLPGSQSSVLRERAKGQPEQLTQAESQAVRDGFPEKCIRSVEPILELLDKAARAADRGDIVTEERCRLQATGVARSAGLLSRGKVRSWLEDQFQARTRAGKLRRDVSVVGSVGRSLQVFSDRLIHKDSCYALDADVRASVEVDGQILQSIRPTMTRMAIGSVLPSSALLVGLAMPKTETETDDADDARRADFIVVHPRWRIVERLDPDYALSTRSIAAQINAIAESLNR